MKREPALKVGTVTAVVSAVLALLAAFGLDLSQDQTAAILGVVAVLAPIVAAVITRSKVTPVESVSLGQGGRAGLGFVLAVLSFLTAIVLAILMSAPAQAVSHSPQMRDTNWPCAGC